jgi:hypothetical protein
MQINLNDPEEFTFDNVRKLLASGRNDQDVQIRIRNDGTVYLSYATEVTDKTDMAFHLETMDAYNDFIGPQAPAVREPVHVAQVFYCLQRNWPNRTSYSVEVLPFDFAKLVYEGKAVL